MASSLYRLCAKMVMVGFPGMQLTSELKSLIDDGIFGAILFRRNVDGAENTSELCRELKAASNRPLVLGVDQEGGRVARLRNSPFSSLPPMRTLGATKDEALVERAGQLLAYELRAVGFDWNFAPILDVDTNPQNPVIGDRAFHSDPAWVGKMGTALARGLEQGGVASCGKHFPGHGDTHQDSHLTLPHLGHSWQRLRQVEWPPFAHYAKAGLASIMTAHVIFDALDANVPATMSEKLLRGVLREELGFQGVIVSDDLEMKAIADNYPISEATVRGALAGVDLFLVCHSADRQREAIEALVKAVENGQLPKSRVEEACARLDSLSARFFHPLPAGVSRLGSMEHLQLAQGLHSRFEGKDPTEVLT